jgi:Ca-activated chloride channel family protein
VTALYEITPVGSAAISVDPLRYGEAQPLPEGNGELAFLKLRYKLPGQATSNLITTPVLNAPMDQVTQDVIFSTAVASFGQLLRGDTRMGGWSYDDVLRLARQGKGEDTFGYRSEFIRLVRLAETAQ